MNYSLKILETKLILTFTIKYDEKSIDWQLIF